VKLGGHLNYLCTYDLYGPVRKVFDATDTLRGEMGGGGWRWKPRVLWAPVKFGANLGPYKYISPPPITDIVAGMGIWAMVWQKTSSVPKCFVF
jgi:hypothetical protein